mgnify:CR=1 FL=1
MAKPVVVVESDFDGYFERLVKGWVAQKERLGGEFQYREVRITAGPYRGYDVRYDASEDGILKLDFYSPLRHVRGLDPQDERDLVSML